MKSGGQQQLSGIYCAKQFVNMRREEGLALA